MVYASTWTISDSCTIYENPRLNDNVGQAGSEVGDEFLLLGRIDSGVSDANNLHELTCNLQLISISIIFFENAITYRVSQVYIIIAQKHQPFHDPWFDINLLIYFDESEYSAYLVL